MHIYWSEIFTEKNYKGQHSLPPDKPWPSRHQNLFSTFLELVSKSSNHNLDAEAQLCKFPQGNPRVILQNDNNIMQKIE